jgi:hypothetical protein
MTFELGNWPGKDRSYRTKDQRDRAYNGWIKREKHRIANQRALFAALPNCEAKRLLQQEMIDRAIWLIDVGHPGAAALLLEFIPAFAADAAMTAYFNNQESISPVKAKAAPITEGERNGKD